jgi:hypothetical protein
MSDRTHHSEWLSLIDVSGPFLAEPVLKEAFPQGLGGLDSAKKTMLRQAYDEWREARDLDDPLLPKIHAAWIDLVLNHGLELDEQGKADVLKPRAALSETLACELPEHGVTLRPDFALVGADGNPLMLIVTYDPETSLTDAGKRDSWAASPAERMIELCRATQVRLGLVTNGEHWMFVDAKVNTATTMAIWNARLWGQEPLTLQAFVNLLGIRRFFVDRSEQLPALLDKSLEHQDEVTDALGEQVRRAVEVLIQALDRADVDRKRELLEDIEPRELYEAGLTVMMRIVFLLSAEERGLLLMGDPRYEANYAISTLRLQLRASSDEILERRWDAWSRLLSIFRAIYAGIDHASMRLPALGGSLFDPDRYPLLEGRGRGSNWKSDPAKPLPIDNRTVLLLLEAVQLFKGRTLSYLALDVEQIGYVYEGLLERTAVRAPEVTLDLAATKKANNPWVSLPELDDAAAKGGKAVEELLQERTESAATRVRNDLGRRVDDISAERLLAACHGDRDLRDRIKPYFHLLRTDPWGYPLVYPKDTFMVRTGSDRRETGTHYTPRPLTEAIVTETLEPLAYIGPAEGKPRAEWKLKAPSELLDLKICDPAMGSGAFLVQVCRWLSERMVEAWQAAEAQGKAISAEGDVLLALGANEPLRPDPAERLLTAKRLIAERCIYGVDMNPLAVELAKLSIWLITLAKGRPFGFLDHNLRSGDSLLGLQSLDQLKYLELEPSHSSSKRLFASNIDKAIEEALTIRATLRTRPIRDIRDIAAMAELNEEASKCLTLPQAIADALFAQVLKAESRAIDVVDLSVEAGEAVNGAPAALEALRRRALDMNSVSTPFHWPLSFPEVFASSRGGFDAFVGNPPFLGGQRISGTYGGGVHAYLVNCVTYEEKSSVDLVVYFFLRVFILLRQGGVMGMLGRRSISEGKNRDAGLSQILKRDAQIYFAITNIPWPGKASIVVHQIHIGKNLSFPVAYLNRQSVTLIGADLSAHALEAPKKLSENARRIYQGSILLGEGFKIDAGVATAWIDADERYRDIVYPFLGGNEINSSPTASPQCWVINFWNWPQEKAAAFADAFNIVERTVRPRRRKNKRPARRDRWWIYGETATSLYRAIGYGQHLIGGREKNRAPALSRVLAISTGITKYPAFTFLPPRQVFSNKLCVLADDRYAIFAVLSSDFHAIWAWLQKTSMGGDLHSLVYAHGNIFETFPFPDGMMAEGDVDLERLGQEFFERRQSYMEELGVGLTGIYNAFHDQTRNDTRLVDLRRRQIEINRSVLARYGWGDIQTEEAFHQVGYLPSDNNLRFTVSEPARLEVLKRLAMLNRDRSESLEEPDTTEPEQDEPLEEGLFAPREVRRATGSG